MTFLAAAALCLISATLALDKNVSIETGVGTIVGEVASVNFNGTTYKFRQFLAIPYAEPPVGERRFKKPTRKSNFTEPFIAQTMPVICPQNNGYLDFFGITLSRDLQSEDCLTLNIFSPDHDVQADTKRAVMVWIHGGFYEVENQNWYLATMLAASEDIIYVTLNYRLSVLGFLSTGDSTLPGNNGLWDQHLALQWVHDNIKSFGGDPEKVTIAGESAGAAAVIHHALYRGSQTLFQRVITQSGSANNGALLENKPLDKFKTLSSNAGCAKETHEETISCLTNLTYTEVLDQASVDINFFPVVDGEFIEIPPNDVFLNRSAIASEILRLYGSYDIMFGFNSGEGILYSGTMDALINNGEYNKETFEKTIIPFVLKTTKVTDTPTLRHAISNQYIDWSNPHASATMRQTSVNLMGDLLFNEGIIKSAMMHSESPSAGATYLYIFDHRSQISVPGLLGSNHAEEVIYALGFPLNQLVYFYGINFTDPADKFTLEDLQLAKDMMEYWCNFVKTGNPSQRSDRPSSLTSWPEYDVTSQQYIHLKGGLDAFPVGSRYTAARMHFWHQFVPTIYEDCDKTCEICRTGISLGIASYPSWMVCCLMMLLKVSVF